MQIAYTSDIHVDSTARNHGAIERIVSRMSDRLPDVVVLAGDAGNTLAAVEEALGLFAPLGCPKLFVAGNHDVWIERKGGEMIDSRAKCQHHLPALCAKYGFHDLGRKPYVIDGVAFVGSLGWYDYTFADPRLGLSDADYWRGKWPDDVWWDKDMVFWPAGDGARRSRLRDDELCAELTAEFARQLDAVENDVEHVVAVVHTVPFVESIPRQDPPYLRDAFTGSRHLGDVLRAHGKVRHCIGAHKHLEGDWTVGGIHYHRRPLGRISRDEQLDPALDRGVGFFEL